MMASEQASFVGVTAHGASVILRIGNTGFDVQLDPDTATDLAKEIVRQAGVARFNFDQELDNFLSDGNAGK